MADIPPSDVTTLFPAEAAEHAQQNNDVQNIEIQALQRQLAELESEHRDLDDVIERLADDKPFDQLKLQRLKKRKLILKDEMTLLRSRILPDIIA